MDKNTSCGSEHEKHRKRTAEKTVNKIIRGICLFAAALFCGTLLAVLVSVAEQKQTSVFRQQAQAEPLQADERVKKLALTFDDGPNPEYTGVLLDGLRERGVQATFFVLGEEVERYPELVRRAADEGHLVGVHAYRHVNLRQMDAAQATEQLERTAQAIREACGVTPSYIRPPYGCWNDALDDTVQMVEVLWDIDPRDWATTSSDLVVQRIVNEVEENSIILLHDASESSVQAALRCIDLLREQGYTFVTVDELLLE